VHGVIYNRCYNMTKISHVFYLTLILHNCSKFLFNKVPYHKHISGYKNYDTFSSMLHVIQKFGVSMITTSFFQI
jgi:hypothetical protein